VQTIAAYFQDKARRDVDATVAHFSEDPFVYIDASLGWSFPTREDLRGLFAEQMPQWPDGTHSYVTRILGDHNSAIVYFTNDPGIFFPADMRSISVVNFIEGKIARWLDYWDYNHIGAANLGGLRLPDDQFPTDFQESLVGEMASVRIKQVAAGLNGALATNEPDRAAALFAPDATYADLTAHVRITGRRHITSFLTGAQGTLPYTGAGVQVRHVVGSDLGGGYEWKANGIVPRGVNVLELDDQGQISNFESVWDGSRLNDDELLRLAAAAIER
jgi:hypothetical protein